MPNSPLILAIDTSCDDTSAAVTSGTHVLSNVIASQTQLHKQFGGVFPTVAKQAHKENIAKVVTLALRRAGLGSGDEAWEKLTAVAVTRGPGLAPALEVGITFAKDKAALYHKPLIPVNHIEGHALSALAQPPTRPTQQPQFPALAVIVSGGHTEFVLVKAIGEYERLGWTVDDAAGEVLDKVGRMLDLGYPAGPLIEQFAKQGNPKAFPFPIPMTTSGDFNMSFSGLKTAARNMIEKMTAVQDLNKTQIYDFCASFQFAVFRAITYKLDKILQKHSVTEVWLGGGVAANMELRRQLRVHIKQTLKAHGPETLFRVPYTKKLCMDNAAMIGVAAGLRWPSKTTSDLTFDRYPRWRIGE